MKIPTEDEYLSHISYDPVIFGFSESKLKVLLLEYLNTGYFALPGGYIKHDEALEDAVIRGLKERTGISDIYLEQFHTFGSVKRHQPQVMLNIMKGVGVDYQEGGWLLGRFISVAYYALIRHDEVTPVPDYLADNLKWYNIDELPRLIFDHQEIIQKALLSLKGGLYVKSIGKTLLPKFFTMKDLQKVYEAILEQPLTRSAFQRKILGLNILERHEKLYTGKSHKAPYLYSFREGLD